MVYLVLIVLVLSGLETHEINEFGEDCSEKRMDVIFDEIKSFLCPTGNEEYPPVFCERKELLITVGCLDWLCKRLSKLFFIVQL